jgi:hypothetical protein
VLQHISGRHNGDGDETTHAHSTLSAETTHVQVFYPFHPLRGSTLQIVRRPKRGDGAVCVIDPTARRLKIPVWMLLPDSAKIEIAEQPYLSKEALLSLASLLETSKDSESRVHANLLPAVVDTCKGGQRAATTTRGSGDRKSGGHGADRRRDTNGTDRSHGPHSGGGLSNGRRKSR